MRYTNSNLYYITIMITMNERVEKAANKRRGQQRGRVRKGMEGNRVGGLKESENAQKVRSVRNLERGG